MDGVGQWYATVVFDSGLRKWYVCLLVICVRAVAFLVGELGECEA
jgi:hypothetical protein